MKCELCPLKCGSDRTVRVGACGAGDKINIAKFYLHPYEEPIISGKNGSGTVFFTGCSLKCVFCQNYELSRSLRGKDVTVNELADIFKKLEDMGAANINLVSPTHFSDKIINALDIYKPKIPIVYNTHGYETLSALRRINDYVDVYLPDVKFFSSEVSNRYCGRADYFEVASAAVEYMTQKPLVFGDDGLIKSGVIVRHLVLPMNVSDSERVLDWFSSIKNKAYINVMSQYTPFGKIDAFPELKRKITRREYETVINYAISLGIENMYYQKYESVGENYIPHWDF